MHLDPAVATLARKIGCSLRKKNLDLPSATPSSAQAFLVWAAQVATGKPVVWVTDGPKSLETAHSDLLTLLSLSIDPVLPEQLVYYPSWETFPGQDEDQDPDLTGLRLAALARLSSAPAGDPSPAPIVTTCIQALMQRTVSPATLEEGSLRIREGSSFDVDNLSARLETAAYSFEAEVVTKGQAALRGGILDLWPPTEPWPLRLEVPESAVESIRAFDPATQRSLGRMEAVRILPASEWRLSRPLHRGKAFTLTGFLADDCVFAWSDPASLRDHADIYTEAAREANAGNSVVTLRTVLSRTSTPEGVRHVNFGALGADDKEPVLQFESLPGVFGMSRDVLEPDLAERSRIDLLEDLARRSKSGQDVLLLLDSPGSLERFRETIVETLAGRGAPVHTAVGVLSEGFVCPGLGLAIVAEPDLYGRRKTLDRRYDPRPRTGPSSTTGPRFDDLSQIDPGDLVVHTEHGIGRYLGLYEITLDDRKQEVLTIEYAEGAKLHVPVAQAGLLSRYVGVARRTANLHRLGGKRWNTDKMAAQEAIFDLASSLLDVQAHRDVLNGHAFSADSDWQHEFEASFPYRETSDQVEVIRSVKGDMESTRPMDRLICGDAGYGKTEVAMRAAFKAVADGKQVAVLVPTTVLAQQHFRTFSERMAPYPFRIEMLSRFRSRGQRLAALQGAVDGAVDILVGTHALLQPDVRFKDLGLVIIDEEQRFGVAHKEKLKELRRLVDVLTLTATPIPRTLYMSMTGARDMSLLQTPPRERMAIETVVARNTDKIVREAVLREMNREGQVFYLHNRVMSIERARQRLAELVPQARITVAHGQMASRELATVMQQFVRGEFDVLLCTTIIESGMDIPRANTILIDRADRFGLADLYQLRGRVGRSKRKAYAYLLLPSHAHLDSAARRRIAAIRKYSGLSVGFALAVRDLEIRGAGNMLGAQQSGHIASIGFGLYCQLLRRSIAHLKGEPPPRLIEVEVRLDFISLSPAASSEENAAVFPRSYVEDEHLRVRIYRNVAEAVTTEELDGLRDMLRDAHGPLPPPADRLLRIAELRILASEKGVASIETREGKIMLTRDNDYVMTNRRFPRLEPGAATEQIEQIAGVLRGLE